MNDFIRRRIARQPRGALGQIAVGLGWTVGATLLRVLLNPILGAEGVPFVTYFPAVVIAALVGGGAAGLTCLLASSAAGAWFFLPPAFGFSSQPDHMAGVATFVLSAGLVAWLSRLLGETVRDLSSAHEHEHRLVLELQHRVKNTLAIVQALATETFRAAGAGPAFKSAFTERLIALGRAHNILSEKAWSSVTLGDLVRGAVGPFVADRTDRLQAVGEPVTLTSDMVVDLALCLHELATNATKYGALSTSQGRVSVTWRVTPGATPRVHLAWREEDGPAVQPTTRQGFGSRLLQRGLSPRLNPKVKTDLAAGGLVWTAEFDAPRT